VNEAMFDLTGRRALVTGSTRGIGRAIALGLARHGAAVAVHGTKQAAADDMADELRARGVKAVGIAADLSDAAATDRLADEAVAALGGVDVLICNASVQFRRPWDEVPLDEFEMQVNVNLRSTLRLVAKLGPAMCQRGWGRIITIGSVQQYRPHHEMVTYAATKAAQVNAVMNLAKQLGEHGVTVNNIAPGVIDTDRNAAALADETIRQRVMRQIPLRSIGEPTDCVGAAVLMCSEAGRYITGADLIVDGGMRLP